MRKFLALAATVILGGALLIAGCGNDNNKQAANNGKQVLKIGATAVPHAEILEEVCIDFFITQSKVWCVVISKFCEFVNQYHLLPR